MQSDVKLAILALVLATAVKVLLMPTYSSTDMEVHRNWMAITYHVARDRWCVTLVAA